MEDLMNNAYSTKDLGECVALVTYGLVLKNIAWKEGIAYFMFDDAVTCREISQKYFFQNLSLPVRKYHENLNLIKSRLYSAEEFLNSHAVRNKARVKGGGRHHV